MSNHSIKGSPMDKPPYVRTTKVYQSLGAAAAAAVAVAAQAQRNTPEKTATMHKSNGVPVFSKESIVEINTMRRG